MRITWYGHAAFRVETGGLSLILDPYRWPDAGGYAPIEDNADVVVVSHENDRYHSHLGQIRPPFQVVRGLEVPPEGVQLAPDVHLDAIHVFETPEKLPEDEVTLLHFRSEGLHVVFLGDLGHPLDESELAPLRGADVVLASAGGKPTIAINELVPLLEAIGPRFVVPMHYKTPWINLNILEVQALLDVLDGWEIRRCSESSVRLSQENLPPSPTILVLEPARPGSPA
ncbi:MAG TPA: MBL fold metallo-hydrolase [Isosphaeraceae bacterium]|nr:MBL fold metallo-hydrolase [Isosphaeraceae bacterium]